MKALLLAVAFVGCTDDADTTNPSFVIDRAQVTPSPDVPHHLTTCVDGRLELVLDPHEAVAAPEGEELLSAWIVNGADRPSGRADAVRVDTRAPWVEPFTFDACDNPNVVAHAVNTVELYVRDDAPRSTQSVAETQAVGSDGTTTTASVIWFVEVGALACCGVL